MASIPDDPQASGRMLPVRQTLLAVSGLCVLIMMVAVDQTVVGTALPTVIAELKGFELYAWVATGYLLTSVITIPIFGRLGDYYGRKPFVIASILIFTVASIMCGLATSMEQLVAARALQGVGGGMLIGTGFACVPDLFPDPRTRLRWQVLFSSAFGIANAIGPTLGGFLTQYIGWRSVFFVNLPLGLISLALVWRFLPHIRQVKLEKVRVDWLGAVLIAVGLAGLQFFAEFSARGDALPLAAACGAVTLLAFLALYHWEKRVANPMLPMELFTNRGLNIMFLLSLALGCVMFTLLIYVPLLLQGGFDLRPRDVGLLITPMVVCITVGSLVSARIVVRMKHPTRILYIGFLLLAVSCLGLFFIQQETPRILLVMCLAAAGVGLGFIMPNLNVFVQEMGGRSLLGISTAVLQSIRMVGGMLGTTLVGTLVARYYVDQVQRSAPAGYGTSWLPMLSDPQVLVNEVTQSQFMAQLQRLGLHGDAFLDLARQVLVDAIHLGLVVVMLAALLSLFGVYRLPLITFVQSPAAASATRKPE